MPQPHVPRVGEIWYVDFSPQVGRGQAGIRPALVISSDWFNETENGLHIVCPLTTVDRGLDYHIRVESPEAGLTRTSFIMCDQEKSQSLHRFLQRRGTVSREMLETAQRMVGRIVDAHRLFKEAG